MHLFRNYYGYLKKKGHDVSAMIPDPDPAFLHWMPYHDSLWIFNRDTEPCKKIIRDAELLISVDYNSLSRFEKASVYLEEAPGKKILIDHHADPDKVFSLMISDIEVSCTAELVYDFIIQSDDRDLIDKDIAACIYSGIITDT